MSTSNIYASPGSVDRTETHQLGTIACQDAIQNNALSPRFARFIHQLSYDDLPPEVIDQAKQRILDAFATALHARQFAVPAIARQFVARSHGEATIYGEARPAAAIDAAFVNATLINGGTHDDFLEKSHAGAVTIPAASTIADEHGGSGRDFLVAVVAGYELVGRTYLGGPTMLPRFRATGTAGAIGAAAAAARMLGLPTEAIAHALGCSTMFASGFGEGFLSGTMDVKLNVGWACRSGVSAALLAKCGATAAATAFEGPSGFYQALANTAHAAPSALEGLGQRYLITDTVYKERPVCVFVQTPMELTVQLTSAHTINSDKIERVTVRVPHATYTNPGFRNVAPFTTSLQARISASFCIAAALLGKPLESHELYQRLHDPQLLALAAKVHLVDAGEDPLVQVEVVHDGDTLSASGLEMDTLRPSIGKITAKFRRLTSDLERSWVDRLQDTVMALEQLKDVRELTNQLRLIAH